MADLKLIGAVAVKVRPDAKGFKGETRRQVLKELAGQEYDVVVNLDLDTQGVKEKAKKAVAEVKKEAEKSVELRFNLDYDSLGKAERQVDAALKKLEERTMKMTMDPASLAAHKAVLKSMRANSKVEMEVVDDAQGWQEQLNKIKQIQREKLVKKITFTTDDNELKRLANDLQNKISAATSAGTAITRPKMSISVSADRASLEKTLRQLDAELARFKEIKMDVELTPESIERERKAIADRLANTPLNLKVNFDDQDSIKAASKKLQQMIAEAGLTDFPVDISTEEGLAEAKRKIDGFIHEEDKTPIELKPYVPGTALEIAAAHLKYATRDRQVNFFVNVNKKSLVIAEGLIRSLSGLGVLTSVGKRLEDLIVNFDKFSLKSAGWSVAIGNLVNVLGFLGTSALTVGEGMVQSIGLLATLPTALAAVAAAVVINVAAFKDFKAAIDGDAKALAALPPEARAAANALRGTWDSIQKPVQKAFWVGMGESIQRFAKNTIPVLRDGLTAVADDVGKFNAGILASFEEVAKNGDMKKMFGNLEGFFQQATGASKPFFDALNTLGLRGSDYLPRFGGFLTDIAKGFDDWITKANEAGKINVWIEKGVQSLKDMGSVGKSVVDMFKGVTRAVNDAGGGGLPEFRDNMRSIADIMLAEPFRSRMATVFAGARKGATELNKGVKELGDTIGASAGYVSELLTGLGKLGGGLLSGLAKALGQLQFQTGTLEGIKDMQAALGNLGPSFEGLGRIIGNMSRVAGEIFKGVAPVINTVVGFLDKSVGKLTGNLEKVAPSLTGLVNALVTAASGPLALVVDLLNATLTVFNGMPGPVQLATGAFLTFLALRGPLGTFMGNLQTQWGKLRGVNADGTRQMSTLTATMARAVAESNIAIRRFDGTPMTKQLHTIGQKALTVGKQVGGSLMAFAGGPWGIALATAGALIAGVGDAAAKQKGKLDDLRTALDGQQGINVATENVIASQLRAKDSFLFWEKASIADSAGNIGISLRDLQKAAEGVPDSIERVNDALRKASEARNPFEKSMDFIKTLGDTQMLGNASGLGSILGGLFGSDMAKSAAGLQKIKDDLAAARREVEATSKQLGVPVGVTAGIMSAIETLADKASTAEDKLRAVNDVIRQMNGQTTLDDAIQKSNDSSRDFVKNLQEIVKIGQGEGLALPALFKADGSINTVSKAGSDLRTELSKVADSGRDAALKLALAQKDPQVAIQTLRDEMEKTRTKIAEELKIGGVPPEQIEAILQQLNLDPAKIEFLLNPESKDKALADLAIANGQVQAEVKPIGLDVDATKASDKLKGATFEIGEFNNLKPTPKLDADKSPFDGVVAQAKGTGAGLDVTTYTPNVDANKSPFDTTLGNVRAAGELMSRNTYSPTVSIIGNALTDATNILDTLRNIGGKVFEASVNILGKVFGGESANGSIYRGNGGWDPRFQPKYFANGGIEKHVAQIAKPSSVYRVWAEPETGGEAYIPLASSKRARSTAILDEVASKFGYSLVKNAEAFANGAVVGGAGSGGGMSVHIDASPGVAYLYAKEVATEATTKLRDMQAVYDIA